MDEALQRQGESFRLEAKGKSAPFVAAGQGVAEEPPLPCGLDQGQQAERTRASL